MALVRADLMQTKKQERPTIAKSLEALSAANLRDRTVEIAERHGTTIEAVLGDAREANIVAARHAAWIAARETRRPESARALFSFTTIARLFRRSASSVMEAMPVRLRGPHRQSMARRPR